MASQRGTISELSPNPWSKRVYCFTQKCRATQVIFFTIMLCPHHSSRVTIANAPLEMVALSIEPKPGEAGSSEIAARCRAPEIPIGLTYLRRVRAFRIDLAVCQESWSNLLVCPQLEEADLRMSLLTQLKNVQKRLRSAALSVTNCRQRPCRLLRSVLQTRLACTSEQVILGCPTACIEWSQTWLALHQSKLLVYPEQVDGLLDPGHLFGPPSR